MEKERTFKHIKANNSYEEAFCQLGQSWDISAELFQKLPDITCHIYGSIKCFMLDAERWIPVNFHLVKTACLCMSFVRTTRLQFGELDNHR